MRHSAFVMGADYTCLEVHSLGGHPFHVVIGAAVGDAPRCQNRHNDVMQIQQALNRFPAEAGGPEISLKVDGLFGPKTKSAIHHFQEKWDLDPKGRKQPDDIVDTDGPTIRRLRKGPGARTKPAVDFLKFIPRIMEIVTAARAAVALAKLPLINAGPGLRFSDAALERVNRHFHVSKSSSPQSRLNELESNFFRMQSAIGYVPRGLVLAVLEPPKVAVGAWMFSFAGGYDSRLKLPKDDPNYIEEDEDTPPQSIYICPKARALNDDGFAYSMIHELAHFTSPFGSDGIHDFAYFHRDPVKYRSLDPDTAFHNADCYPQFAFDAIGKPNFNITLNSSS